MKKFLGILGAVIAAAAIYFGIMFAPEIKAAFLGNTPEPPTQDVEEPGEPTGDVVTDIVDSEALRLTKYNRVSANGQALSVVATIDEYADIKTVSWALSWKSTNSGNVADYVTITPSADTLTCTVAVKKAFTTQIILTCTANSNASVKATCTIDYVGRDIKFNKTSVSLGSYKFDTMTYDDLISCIGALTTSNYTLSGGSLVGTLSNVKVKEIALDGEDDYLLNDSIVGSKTLKSFVQENYDVSGFSSLNAALRHLEEETECLGFSISYDITYNGTIIKSGTTSFTCSINWGDITITADSLTLNDSQLIF